MRDSLSIAARYAVVGACLWLPQDRQKAIERWLRGREEYVKSRAADVILMSFGKSGRTWLRLMLSRVFQQVAGVDSGTMLEFDNFKRIDPAIPSLYFTHGNYLRNYTGDWTTKADFYAKRILMLTRDPRDIAVSQYFQWKFRMLPRKKMLNDYPPHGADVSLFDFVVDPKAGLPVILDFLEVWQRELPKAKDSVVVRYEDMRADPGRELGRALDFLGVSYSQQQLDEAVAFASYENMKQLEQKQVFRTHGQRLVPGDRENPDSYKVRRAKVGGYRDYFSDEQVAEIDDLMSRRTRPLFGYLDDAPPKAAAEG
jgi:Sulfotransferase domain